MYFFFLLFYAVYLYFCNMVRYTCILLFLHCAFFRSQLRTVDNSVAEPLYYCNLYLIYQYVCMHVFTIFCMFVCWNRCPEIAVMFTQVWISDSLTALIPLTLFPPKHLVSPSGPGIKRYAYYLLTPIRCVPFAPFLFPPCPPFCSSRIVSCKI